MVELLGKGIKKLDGESLEKESIGEGELNREGSLGDVLGKDLIEGNSSGDVSVKEVIEGNTSESIPVKELIEEDLSESISVKELIEDSSESIPVKELIQEEDPPEDSTESESIQEEFLENSTEQSSDFTERESHTEQTEDITPTRKASRFISRRNRRHRSKPTDAPLKALLLPPLDPQVIDEQQRRLDAFLLRTRDYQITGLEEGRQVIYKIHRESGLGNMIRGYITSFAVAILTNRAIQRSISLYISNSENPKRLLFSVLFPAIPPYDCFLLQFYLCFVIIT